MVRYMLVSEQFVSDDGDGIFVCPLSEILSRGISSPDRLEFLNWSELNVWLKKAGLGA